MLHLAIISYDEDDGETIASVSDYVALNKKYGRTVITASNNGKRAFTDKPAQS